MTNIKKTIFIALASIIALVLAVYFIQKLSPRYIENVQPKLTSKENFIPTKDFLLKDLTGKKWSLSDLRGKIIILTFWTSWNKYSVEQIKNLNGYARSHAQNNVVVLAVGSQEATETVAAIKASENLDSVTVLLDADGAVGELYGISVLPLTIFINPVGLQTAKVIGPLSSSEIDQKISSMR